MKIQDNRRANKCVMFNDLEVGSVFEHVNLNMIMIKLDETNLRDHDGFFHIKNALCIYDADVAALGGSTSTELWHVSPESKVIPVNAKLVIEE